MDFALSWVDLGLALVMLLSVGMGLWRGLVFELMSLAGWVVAYFAASPLALLISPHLPESKLGPAVAHVVALALAFALVLLVWGLVARLIKSLIHASPLSVLDRLGGAGFGALRGVLVALVVVLFGGATPVAESATWKASKVVTVLGGMLQDLQPLMPEPVARFVSRSMRQPSAASTD